MKIRIVFLVFLGISIFSSAPYCFSAADIIEQLTDQIAAAKTDDEKSRLHMYRARNYKNMGEMDMAEKDYDAALSYDHKGWIHLERSRYYFAMGDYQQAKKEAQAAGKETPTLKSSAEPLIVQANKSLAKKKRQEQPREILLTRKWKATYTRTPPQSSSGNSNVRKNYAAKSKERAKSRPRRARS